MFTALDLAQLYYATAGFGFIFFLFTAMTARGAHAGGHGGHLSHGVGHGMGGHGVGGAHGIAGGHGLGSGHGLGGAHGGGHGIGGGHGLSGAQGGAHGIGGGHGAGHGAGATRIGGVQAAGGHGAGGHGVAGHSGAAGAQIGGARGTAPAHAGAAGQNVSGARGGVSDGSASVQGQGQGLPGQAMTGPMQVQGSTGQAVTGPMHVPHDVHRWSPVEVFLAVCNPMRFASFCTFFGIFGRVTQILFPSAGAFTLIVATVAGVIGSNLILAFFAFVYSRFRSSSMSIVSDLIGHMGEISVPIPAGRMGEITYIVESKRYTSSARGTNATASFKKGDKVIIADIQNAVSFVEPWSEDFIDEPPDSQVIDVSEKKLTDA